MLFLKGLLLGLMGARHIGFHLAKNSLFAFFGDRKKRLSSFRVPVLFFKGVNTDDFYQYVKDERIDLVVNARTRFIYKSKILKLPRFGAINIHHGLLPDYRGTMCDLWALFQQRPTGFSIHVMEKKIDNGAIIRRIVTTSPNEKKDLPLRQSFARLIAKSARREGQEMAILLKEINSTQKIPILENNISPHPEYTKNPDFLTIRKMRQKGMQL